LIALYRVEAPNRDADNGVLGDLQLLAELHAHRRRRLDKEPIRPAIVDDATKLRGQAEAGVQEVEVLLRDGDHPGGSPEGLWQARQVGRKRHRP
jgi:hypothetical protein